jgi:hypothetical protein
MMPPFITAQSINFAFLGAENNPLDLALGKVAGIGGGDPPAPFVTGFDFDLEGRFAGILLLHSCKTIPSFATPQVIMRPLITQTEFAE